MLKEFPNLLHTGYGLPGEGLRSSELSQQERFDAYAIMYNIQPACQEGLLVLQTLSCHAFLRSTHVLLMFSSARPTLRPQAVCGGVENVDVSAPAVCASCVEAVALFFHVRALRGRRGAKVHPRARARP